MNKSVWAGALALAALLWQAQAARAQEEKACDCNGNDEVVINELITGVNILLGNAGVATCEAADVNDNGNVQVNELVQCVNCANGNCGGGGNGPLCGNSTEEEGRSATTGTTSMATTARVTARMSSRELACSIPQEPSPPCRPRRSLSSST
jgi:hypothetical protein